MIDRSTENREDDVRHVFSSKTKIFLIHQLNFLPLRVLLAEQAHYRRSDRLRGLHLEKQNSHPE